MDAKLRAVATLIFTSILIFGMPCWMRAQDGKTKYPSMAPLEQYLMDRQAEIALARGAAPDSISHDAKVVVRPT